MQKNQTASLLCRPEQAQRAEGPASPRISKRATDSSTRLRLAQNDMQKNQTASLLCRPEQAQRAEGPASPRISKRATDSSTRLRLAQNDMQNGESQFHLRRPERAQRVEGPASPLPGAILPPAEIGELSIVNCPLSIVNCPFKKRPVAGRFFISFSRSPGRTGSAWGKSPVCPPAYQKSAPASPDLKNGRNCMWGPPPRYRGRCC